jgi:hypothetical protein
LKSTHLFDKIISGANNKDKGGKWGARYIQSLGQMSYHSICRIMYIM